MFKSSSAQAVMAALGIKTANPLSVIAAGTLYALTNAQAAVDFGTTDPSLTLTAPGQYLILAAGQLDYNAATFAAVRIATMKLRRTNNTAADLASATAVMKTGIITTLTYTLGQFFIPALYTTANSDDAIALFGGLDTAPTAGSLDVAAAKIIAIRLSTP